MTEERRREELARQVQVQRRKLKKAIKRTASCGVDEDDSDSESHDDHQADDGSSSSSDDQHHHGDDNGHHDRDAHHNTHHARQHPRHHDHHHHGGGICGALTGLTDHISIASSSSSSGPSHNAVQSPQMTATGTGMHVEVHMPDLNLHEGTESESLPDIVVEPEPHTDHKSSPFILNPSQMKSVAATVLPPSVRYCRWKRLYSLTRDGDSFDAFLRLVRGWKRTLLVVTTSRGAVMGAYADSPWENQHQALSAAFYGSAQACLWRLEANRHKETTMTTKTTQEDKDTNEEDKIIAYRWTGANRYIQICDASAKILAFGGGGAEGEFGLCVEDDFRRGSTGRCETFGNDPLCDQDQFDIVDLECWGFPTGFA